MLTPLKNREMLLRGAPRFNGPSHRGVDLRQGTGVGGVEADEDFVCGVLQPSVRLVQLPGSFARQLAELVTIGDVRKCSKNQIRTHKVKLLPGLVRWHYLVPAIRLLARYKIELLPQNSLFTL
jgi:hypothetical protein